MAAKLQKSFHIKQLFRQQNEKFRKTCCRFAENMIYLMILTLRPLGHVVH